MAIQTTMRSQNEIETSTTRTPLLPPELWLQVLEHDDPVHLWVSVRNISRTYKHYVERVFTSKYLHMLEIFLSLPRRDPATSKLKWPGDPIPGSQLAMAYAGLSEDGRLLHLESATVVRDRNGEKTLEELRSTGVLPKERLEEAPTNVNMSTNPMASLPIQVPVQVEWNEARKVWTWEVEWRTLLRRLFNAKDKQRKRWPTTIWSSAQPHGLPWRGRQA
ncbi:hypothetical protein C7974DRAFT_370874 [Boeremia exigua]|uniref:uncharacterized protein n=1 Tax=Boeremia exigua TaxID=749465 RepID=UPI001E8E0713|nr:uncharacterized protein C7974DRAFT_370874 [Boeremia exigua]KAH6643655.1 hypothetical protein C7974DRAFT_370874 [Boeremia exigua]